MSLTSKYMFKSLGKSWYRLLNIGTGMSEQILKREVRLFKDGSSSHSISMFVSNQLIVKSVKVESVSKATAAQMASVSI